MNFDLKLAILKSGKRQWEIAQAASINESKLSKPLHGYALLNDEEQQRLQEVLSNTNELGVTVAEA